MAKACPRYPFGALSEHAEVDAVRRYGEDRERDTLTRRAFEAECDAELLYLALEAERAQRRQLERQIAELSLVGGVTC